MFHKYIMLSVSSLLKCISTINKSGEISSTFSFYHFKHDDAILLCTHFAEKVGIVWVVSHS